MKSRIQELWKTKISSSLLFKCGTVFLFLLLNALVVACSSANTGAPVSAPAVTLTIQAGNAANASPTPPLPGFWCGAWATQSSPAANMTSSVGVYAKFTQNVNGNPQGVGGATAIATVQWPGGNTQTLTATTTADGLAVFSVPVTNEKAAIGRITLVTVQFNKAGVGSCTVDAGRAAFFTLVVASPTASPGAGNGNGNGNGSGHKRRKRP
jgi:hypothetical protein